MDEHALDDRHAESRRRIAALEAELARTKDALRQANGVRDTFALALVGLVDKGGNLQGHQVDKTMNLQVPNDDEVICPNCVHQFRAIPCNVRAELADERERREAAEVMLQDAYFAIFEDADVNDVRAQIEAHFARYKD